MIRKFIDRLLGKTPPAAAPELPPGVTLGERVEIGGDVHGIDPKLLAEPAVRVVKTLKDEGFEAYIVGGAVRDLLIGRRPKDFDVATNATPEQVKGLFRRAYIVGRRFRLVHVIHGRGREHEQIEVSTFRAYVDAADATQVEGNEKTSKSELADQSHAVDASGRVLRDNVWGPQIEDAARRDFTVNAMYYDPEVADLSSTTTARLCRTFEQARLLRMIGEPELRYREDPVRIVRVLRFAAKLGYGIEPRTEAPIRTMKSLLANVPSSRMFDEMIKLLQTGHSLASLEVLKRYGLDRGVFPILDAHFEGIASNDPAREAFKVNRALADTDRRVLRRCKPVAPSFLMACMFWHEVWPRAGRRCASRRRRIRWCPALQQAIDATFEARIGDISGRGKLAADMREIWLMQPRFEKRVGNAPMAMAKQPRFRAAFDFLRLRADAGEGDRELAEWWADFSNADEDQQAALVDGLRHATQSKRNEKVAVRTEKAAAGAHRKGPPCAARKGRPARRQRKAAHAPGAARRRRAALSAPGRAASDGTFGALAPASRNVSRVARTTRAPRSHPGRQRGRPRRGARDVREARHARRRRRMAIASRETSASRRAADRASTELTHIALAPGSDRDRPRDRARHAREARQEGQRRRQPAASRRQEEVRRRGGRRQTRARDDEDPPARRRRRRRGRRGLLRLLGRTTARRADRTT